MFNKDLDTPEEEFDEGEVVELHDPATSIASLANPAPGVTPVDLARVGVSEIARIRRAIVNDMPMWTIHSASGDPLGAAHSFDQAWAAVKQNDLEPVRVH